MNRKFFSGAALAVLAAAPAVAQPGEGRGRFDQPQTRAAVEARAEARFARADSNRDGFVTRDELRARADSRRADRRERRFERLDSDRDGTISRAEFDSPRLGGERRAMRGERRPDRSGRGGMMRAGFGERAFAAMDMNRDGRVALAEARRAALQRSDRVDTDRDGTVGAEERRAARAARMERRED